MSDGSHVPSLGGEEAPASGGGSNAEKLPVLCRETVLPRERGRGMAGIAIVCSMAGVASGLALAATLMAVQISDRPHSQGSSRSTCWRKLRVVQQEVKQLSLGVEYFPSRNGAEVIRVFPGTAAESVGLRSGDVIKAVDGQAIDLTPDLDQAMAAAGAGATPVLTVVRTGEKLELRPQLGSYPIVIRY